MENSTFSGEYMGSSVEGNVEGVGGNEEVGNKVGM